MRAMHEQSRRLVRFGVFEVDLHEEEIRRSGFRKRLGPQPFHVLQAMLERPGEVITREELRQRLWPGNTFVDYELALKKCVNRIREVLGDSAENPRFIETVPRRGYRFIAPVEPSGLTDVVHQSPRDEQSPEAEEVAIQEPANLSIPHHRILAIAIVGLLMVVLLVTGYIIRSRDFAHRTLSPPIDAIAVLPLENLSADKDSDYYAEGMTDELITQLAKMSKVRVISRTSTMQFEGKRKSLEEIARALNVGAVVEGTVMRSGSRVRITVQLIQANPEHHLWADSYEREERDVLSLQANLATDIARSINANMTRREQGDRAVNVQAHEAYLRGRYWWHRRGTEAETKGLQYFQQAVQIDPTYPAGWAGIADSYVVMAHHGGMPATDAMPKAKAAAEKALEIDDSLAEAHTSLGEVKLSFDCDYPGAEREFNRAIELDPNYATAHHWFAHYLVMAGRFDEALREIQLAHQLDPYSVVINAWWGLTYYYEQNYQQALAQFHSILELDPAMGPAVYDALARVYEQQGDYVRAIEARKLLASENGRLQDGAALSNAYTAGGADAYWHQRLRLFDQTVPTALELAIVYSHLHQRDAALRSLERAFQEHSPWLAFMEREPAFRWLHGEPRFQKLAVRLRLP